MKYNDFELALNMVEYLDIENQVGVYEYYISKMLKQSSMSDENIWEQIKLKIQELNRES